MSERKGVGHVRFKSCEAIIFYDVSGDEAFSRVITPMLRIRLPDGEIAERTFSQVEIRSTEPSNLEYIQQSFQLVLPERVLHLRSLLDAAAKVIYCSILDEARAFLVRIFHQCGYRNIRFRAWEGPYRMTVIYY